MYIPNSFLFAGGCYVVMKVLARVLSCRSRIGRALALPHMMVGCRKFEDDSILSCDVCGLYGCTATVLFGGGMLVFLAIGVWQLVR